MIVFSPEHLKQMADQAEAAYPLECCGLIAGVVDDETGVHHVTRVVPSMNVSDTDRQKSFEIAPQVRFDLMRELDGTDQLITGHYHSHPDSPALPSRTDLSMAYEPDMIWVILSVRQQQLVETRAYGVSPHAASFHPIEISTTDAETPVFSFIRKREPKL